MSNLLPIGTVVTIDSDIKIQCMIMGYYPIDHERNEKFLYAAVLYPYGIENQNSCLLINEEDIVEVVFYGFCNEECNKILHTIPYVMDLIEQEI